MREMDMTKMGPNGTTSPREDQIIRQIEELFDLSSHDLLQSEKYSKLRRAVEDSATLDLNEVLCSYAASDRRRALTFVFRLAEDAGVKTLLLQDNKIDAASLGHSLQDYVACRIEDTKVGKLSSLEEIDFSRNDLHGKGVAALCAIEWPQLRRLVLRENEVQANDCTFLRNAIQAGRLKALESLDLSRNMIGDKAMSTLASSFRKACLPNLRKISLGENFFRDGGVTAIAKAISAGGLESLESIDLSFSSSIADSSMVALASSLGTGQVSLKELDFKWMGLKNASVIELARAIETGNLKSLEKLDLSGNVDVADEALATLAMAFGKGLAPNLQELRLSKFVLGSSSVVELAKAIESGTLELLEKLDLSENADVTGGSLASLATALGRGHTRNLRNLLLSNTGCGDKSIVELAKAIESGNLLSLEKLDVSEMRRFVRKESMTALVASLGGGQMSHLKILQLKKTGVGKESAVKLAEAMGSGSLPSLEMLDLRGNPEVDEASRMSLRASLEHLPHIQEVWVSNNERSSDDSNLVKFYKMRHWLKMKQEQQKEGWEFLSNFSTREDGIGSAGSVQIEKRTVGSKAIPPEEIDISDTSLHGEGIKALCTLDCSQLRKLSLQRTGMTDSDCILLANAVRDGHFGALESIDLSGNEIGDEGICALVDSFQERCVSKLPTIFEYSAESQRVSKLREIAVGENVFGDKGVIALAKAIESGSLKFLEVLNLSGSGLLSPSDDWMHRMLKLKKCITDNSLVPFAGALGIGHCAMTNLRDLRITGTHWGNEGVLKLAEALRSPDLGSIETLHVFGTGKSWVSLESSLTYLATSIGRGHMAHLRNLRISGMELDNKCAVKLAGAIASGHLRALESIDLSWNEIGDEGMRALANSFRNDLLPSLQDIALHANSFGDKGVAAIAEATSAGGRHFLQNVYLPLNESVTDTSLMSLVVSFGVGQVSFGSEGLRNWSFVKLAKAIKSEHQDHQSIWNINDENLGFLTAAAGNGPDGNLRDMLLEDFKVVGDGIIEGLWNDSEFKAEDSKFKALFKARLKLSEYEDESAESEDSLSDNEDRNNDVTEYASCESADSCFDDEDGSNDETRDGARDEDKNNGNKGDATGNDDVAIASMSRRSQLGDDVQDSLISWSGGYNARRMLVLGDLTSSNEYFYFMFFHVEAMTNLFGCGVPFSKVSIPRMHSKEEILIQEMMEESWRALWTSPDQNFMPFSCEEVGNEAGEPEGIRSREDCSLRLSSDEAVSKFGIGVDGLMVQQLTNMNRHELQSTMHFQLRWKSWLSGVLKLMSMPLGYLSQEQQDARASVNSVADDKRVKGQLIVIISFRSPNSPFYIAGDRGRPERIENDSLRAKPVSGIMPGLRVEFCRDGDQKCVTTTLRGEYQMGCEEGVDTAGWYQDDLRLSFQWNDVGQQEGFLMEDSDKLISLIEQAEIESTVKSETSKTVEKEGVVSTGLQGIWGAFSASVSGKVNAKNQGNEIDQIDFKSKTSVLTDSPSFSVSKHNMLDSKMEYKASYVPRMVDGSGLQASVKFKIEGTWELEGTRKHTYDFKASKRLFTQNPMARVNESHNARNGSKWSSIFSNWIGDESSNSISNFRDRQGSTQNGEATLWQIFSRRFILNHNFSEFLETRKRADPYRWRLLSPSNQGNECPVPDALNALDVTD